MTQTEIIRALDKQLHYWLVEGGAVGLNAYEIGRSAIAKRLGVQLRTMDERSEATGRFVYTWTRRAIEPTVVPRHMIKHKRLAELNGYVAWSELPYGAMEAIE